MGRGPTAQGTPLGGSPTRSRHARSRRADARDSLRALDLAAPIPAPRRRTSRDQHARTAISRIELPSRSPSPHHGRRRAVHAADGRIDRRRHCRRPAVHGGGPAAPRRRTTVARAGGSAARGGSAHGAAAGCGRQQHRSERGSAPLAHRRAVGDAIPRDIGRVGFGTAGGPLARRALAGGAARGRDDRAVGPVRRGRSAPHRRSDRWRERQRATGFHRRRPDPAGRRGTSAECDGSRRPTRLGPRRTREAHHRDVRAAGRPGRCLAGVRSRCRHRDNQGRRASDAAVELRRHRRAPG